MSRPRQQLSVSGATRAFAKTIRCWDVNAAAPYRYCPAAVNRFSFLSHIRALTWSNLRSTRTRPPFCLLISSPAALAFYAVVRGVEGSVWLIIMGSYLFVAILLSHCSDIINNLSSATPDSISQ